MVANNSPLHAPMREGRVRTIPHAPESECEKLVYELAISYRASKYVATFMALCPSCKQMLEDLFT